MTRTLVGSLAVHAAIVVALACLVPWPARQGPPAPPPAISVIDVTIAPPTPTPPPVLAPVMQRAHAQRAPLRRDTAPHAAPVATGTDVIAAGDGVGDGGGDADAPAALAVRPVGIKTRPVPIGARQALIPYTRDALEARIEGNVLVDLVVDAAGMPTDVHLARGLGHGLDAIALGLAAELRFHPALDTLDHPIAARITWSFHFAAPRKDRP